jgi:AraC-like DNA-binding protein
MVTLAGKHMYGIDGKIHRVGPGSVLLLGREEPHDALYSPFQADCRDLWVNLMADDRFIAHEARAVGGHFEAGASEVPEELLGRQYRNYSRPVRFRPIEGAFALAVTNSWDALDRDSQSVVAWQQLQAAVQMCILQVLSTGWQQISRVDKNRVHGEIIEQIVNYIRSHPGENLKVDHLAQMAGYESRHFQIMFARHVGQPVHRFVNEVRMREAYRLIRSGLKVKNVSEQLGFATSAYFCRFFLQHTGLTPSKWLEQHGSDPSPQTDR